MSRFTFRAGKDTECQVGWDAPLETFYGQVYKVDKDGRVDVYEEKSEEKDGTIHWVGTSMNEVPTLEELEQKLRPHVQMLPRDIFRKLGLVLIHRQPMQIDKRPAYLLNQPRLPER